MSFTLALRNLWRQRRRTAITFVAISIGLTFLVVGTALLDGVDRQSERNLKRYETADLDIYAPGYFPQRDELPLDRPLRDLSWDLTVLRARPAVAAAAPRLVFPASLIAGMSELPVQAIGIDPALDAAVFDLPRSLVAGTTLAAGTPSLLVGTDLAQALDLAPGGPCTITMRTTAGAIQALTLEVAGVLNTGLPTVDYGTVFLPLDIAQDALAMPGQATVVAVRLKPGAALEPTRAVVSQALAGNELEVYTWQQLAGDYLKISQAKLKTSGLLSLLMVLIAAIGIINTMLMATLERTREIGLFLALGARPRRVLGIFVVEGALLGVLGSLAGIVIGGALSLYLARYGWDFSRIGIEELTGNIYPIKSIIYAHLSLAALVRAFLLGVVVSTLASLLPARRASRLDPARALRAV